MYSLAVGLVRVLELIRAPDVRVSIPFSLYKEGLLTFRWVGLLESAQWCCRRSRLK
jgi:hypothetical protein